MAKYPLALFLLVFYASFSFAQVEDSLPERGMMLNPELSIAPEPGPILSSVELQRQKIYKSLDKALVDPSKVYRLDLSGQKYREFPPQIFRLINLQELILSGNKLKEIPTDIHKLQNLELLVLTQNKLRTLPEEMKEMGNLSRLYVGENHLMAVCHSLQL